MICLSIHRVMRLITFRLCPWCGRDLTAVQSPSGAWIGCRCTGTYTCGACAMEGLHKVRPVPVEPNGHSLRFRS